MNTLEYSIDIDKESGRPYIVLPETYQDNLQDKFLAFELTRMLLLATYNKTKSITNERDSEILLNCGITLQEISDEMANKLLQEMEFGGYLKVTTQNTYHIIVDTIKDRNALNYNGIIYNNLIFKREKGLKVLVKKNMKIYELVDGIDNENWKEL